MKIGLVRRGFSASGGAEAYLLRLAGGLAEAGHEPVLITSGDWPDERWKHGSIVRLPGKTPKKFAEAVASASLDVHLTFSLDRVPGCHVFRAGDGVHAAWLQRRSLYEPMWKRYFRVLNPKHLSMMRLEVEVFQTAHHVIANSHMVAREIAQWHEFPAERIHVVPNGIGPAIPTISREEARKRLGLEVGVYAILFVGTGWERKGLRFAIRAVEQLGSNAVLLVAGRGPEKQYASSRVRFLGPVSDLSALFSAADVFTLPTIYDPFSNACLEALATGLPVITTKANGFSEIITPGVHGDVVSTGDSDALAAALSIWKGKFNGNTATTCRQLAAEYSIARNVNATLEVLTSVTP